MSVLPPSADIVRPPRHVRKVPKPEVAARQLDVCFRQFSSQHDPSDIFASVGIDHNEIDLSGGPLAQFVEAMVVEIVID
jgi:hypothetical protein